MEKGRRRREILDAAREVFAARGYHAASVADIIEAAGIARGTFYLYFESKRAVFDELVDRFLLAIQSCVRLVETGEGAASAYTQLRGNVSRAMALLREEREMAVILLNHAGGLDRESDEKLHAFYDQMSQALVGALEMGRELGLVTTQDPAITARLILGGIKEVTHFLVVQGDETCDHDHLVDEILRFGLQGVAGGLLTERPARKEPGRLARATPPGRGRRT